MLADTSLAWKFWTDQLDLFSALGGSCLYLHSPSITQLLDQRPLERNSGRYSKEALKVLLGSRAFPGQVIGFDQLRGTTLHLPWEGKL